MSESQLLKSCMERLWHERSWITIDRVNCGQVTVKFKGNARVFRGCKPGTGDMMGYMAPNGRHVELEAKWGKNKQEDTQKARQADIEAKGAVYRLIRSPEDLQAFIAEFKPCSRSSVLNVS